MSLSETSSADPFGYQGLQDDELKERFAAMVREIAFRVNDDEDFRVLPAGHSVTINDVMTTVTDLLHRVDVQVFELTMWQAFTGRTAPRNLRHLDFDDEGTAP